MLEIDTSAQHLVLLTKRQLDVAHQLSVTRKLAEKYDGIGHELLRGHRPRDVASLYFEHLPLENAKILLLIRTNSLFKPMQYSWHQLCPLCSSQVNTDDGWEITKHFVFTCRETRFIFIPFRSLEFDRIPKLLALLNLDDSKIADLKIVDAVDLLNFTLASLKDLLFFINTNLPLIQGCSKL